jgi:hypothetical protein
MAHEEIIAKIQFPALICSSVFAQILVSNWYDLVSLGDTRNRWPDRKYWVPGKLLDCSGQEFVLRDVTNIPKMPFWLKPVVPILGVRWYLGVFKADLNISDPSQLTLLAYKKHVVAAVKKEVLQGVTRKKRISMITDSLSFDEILYVLWGKEEFEKSGKIFVPRVGSELSLYEHDLEMERKKFAGKTYMEIQAEPSKIHPLISGLLVVLLLFAVHFIASKLNSN